MLSTLILCIEFLVFIISFLKCKKYEIHYFKSISSVWGLIFIFDLIGIIISIKYTSFSVLFYSVFLAFQSVIYLIVINTWNNTKYNKYLIGLSLLFFSVEFVKIVSNDLNIYPNKSIGILSFLLLINCIYFFYKLIIVNESFNIFNNSKFWIAIGLTLYNTLEFPYMFFLNELQVHYPETMNIFSVFTTITFILMNICFIKAILCCNKI